MNKSIVSHVIAVMMISLLSGCGPATTPVPPTSTPVPSANTPLPTNTTAPTAHNTATDASPTSTLLPPTPETGPLAQPVITDTDRETNALLKTCERTFIVTADHVLVPFLSDCYHQLMLSSMNGNVIGLVSPTGQLGMLKTGMLGAVFMEVRFISYPLSGDSVQKDSGISGVTAMVMVSYSTPDELVVVVTLPSGETWSGLVNTTKSAFNPSQPVSQQAQFPLSEGNQY